MIVLAGNSGKHSPRRPMNPLLRNRTNIPKNLFCWGRSVTIHNVDGPFVEGFVCFLDIFCSSKKTIIYNCRYKSIMDYKSFPLSECLDRVVPLLTDPPPTSSTSLSKKKKKKRKKYDMWHLQPDTGHMPGDMWHVTCDTWHVTYGWWWTFSQHFRSLGLMILEWPVTCDMWHMTFDMWHKTCDMWHMKCDIWSIVI